MQNEFGDCHLFPNLSDFLQQALLVRQAFSNTYLRRLPGREPTGGQRQDHDNRQPQPGASHRVAIEEGEAESQNPQTERKKGKEPAEKKLQTEHTHRPSAFRAT